MTNVRKIVEEQLIEKGVSHVLQWNHGYPEEVYFKGTPEQRVLLREEYPLIQLIENIQGDYESFSELVLGTRRHVDGLWKDRLVVPELSDPILWTADGIICFMRDGKPCLALTRENQNPLFKNEVYKRFLLPKNYHVPDKDLKSALADPSTEVFDLDELHLSRYSDEHSYLELSITNPKLDSLCGDNRRLVERIYGRGDDFYKVMRMMNKKNWPTSQIYVLSSDYVREHASAGAIGRASWLSYNAFFDCYKYHSRERLCGVVSSEQCSIKSDRIEKEIKLGEELSEIINHLRNVNYKIPKLGY